MSKKSSGMQKNIFRPLFHQHQFPNEIFQNRSVCDIETSPVDIQNAALYVLNLFSRLNGITFRL